MCKCCCNCKDNDSADKFLKAYQEQLKQDQEKSSIRFDYVRENLITIISLVWKYNEVLEKQPTSFKEATEKNKLLDELAIKICAYTRI